MSGGPAFDKNGHLIGILTSSLDDENGPSCISSWWPTAGHSIDTSWPNGFVPLPTNLLGLVSALGVMMEGPEALRAATEAGGRTSVTYVSWT